MTNRGAPTPPTDLPHDAATHIQASSIAVSDAVVTALEAEGLSVTVSGDDLDEHGRDWWPLTLGWAIHDGKIPTRPTAVVRPINTEQVSAALRIANASAIPVTAMAGRSGVCGGSLPIHGGIALDLTGLTGIVGVDDESQLVHVRGGMFGDVFEDELQQQHGLTLGHWPQSMALSTVGGWLACRSAGQFSTRYGKIEDMVRGLEVVLADGRVIRTGWRGPREAAGPDLTQLFVGSEGTLGVITEAQLQVWPKPQHTAKAAYGFSSFAEGLEACRLILRTGATPAVLRLYDVRESARNFGTGKPDSAEASNVLIVLDEGHEGLVEAGMKAIDTICAQMNAAPHDAGFVDKWMGHRNDVSGLASVIKNNIVLDTIEIAAPWGPLANIHAQVTDAIMAIPGAMVATCHQSHAYPDGACLYFTFAGRPGDDLAQRDAFYCDVWDAATRTTVGLGGTVSHHHGIGLHRGRFLRETLGAGFAVFDAMKTTLDPNGILNPGKLGLDDPFGTLSWPEARTPH